MQIIAGWVSRPQPTGVMVRSFLCGGGLMRQIILYIAPSHSAESELFITKTACHLGSECESKKLNEKV